MEEIKLQEIIKIIKKRLFFIFFITILSVSIATTITFYILTPIYQAEAQILVDQRGNSEEDFLWSRNEIDLQLISTYNDIITTPFILSKVIEKLQIDTSPESLAHQITLSSVNGSKVLYMDVYDSDPERAVNIANTTAEVFQKEVPKLLKVDNINILSEAKISQVTSPVSPNKMLNLTIGVVIGLMLGIAISFLLETFDTTIKGEKDVEETLDIPIIGFVGLIPTESEKKPFLKSHRARGTQGVWSEK